MPKTLIKHEGLLDTWGRRNRKIPDKICLECGKVFRPLRDSSKYCSKPCLWKNNGGHNKKIGATWWVDRKGYIAGRINLPDGTIIKTRQHRFVMEGILGRPLEPWEDVHHKDGNKQNNEPSNLQLISHKNHTRHSNLNRTHKKGYTMNLTEEQREKRSLRAIAIQLHRYGQSKRWLKTKAEGR